MIKDKNKGQKINILVKRINEQIDDQEYYRISADDYELLMKMSNYNGDAVTKIKKFGGRKLWIDGGVNLRNTPTKSLGNIGFINGTLDVSYTKVSEKPKFKIKGYVLYSNTPLERIEYMRELMKKKEEMAEIERNGEWDLDSDNLTQNGLKANALLEYLNTEELSVYDLYISRNYYEMTEFEILHYKYKDQTFVVGTEDEADDTAFIYARDFVSDEGIEGFNRSFLERFIDSDQVEKEAYDFYYDSIYDDPGSYFSISDFELSDEDEDEKNKLEDERDSLNDELEGLEDPESEEYTQIEKRIELIDKELEKFEIDVTKPTDEMIDDKATKLANRYGRDPMAWISEMGLDISEYVDKDELVKGWVDDEGVSLLNFYDGVSEIRVKGKYFIVARMD